MLDQQWLNLVERYTGVGLILLDREGQVVQTNLKGQVCLPLLGETGKSITHVGGHSLQELQDLSPRPGETTCCDFVQGWPPYHTLEVTVQPVAAGNQVEGWALIVHEILEEETGYPPIEPSIPLAIVHWPPISPVTANKP